MMAPSAVIGHLRDRPVVALAVAIVLVIVLALGVWLTNPSPTTRLSLAAPGSAAQVEIIETCNPEGCARFAVYHLDGERRRCALDAEGNLPIFTRSSAVWADDRQSLVITHSAEGEIDRTTMLVWVDCVP